MGLQKPKLIITIDVERDYDAKWQIPSNLSYRGVTHAIPNILTPLFKEFSISPTYFLSPEVVENNECCEVLTKITSCEFATHLHGEYIPPNRTKYDLASADLHIEEMQCEYSNRIEKEKLASLTELFNLQLGYYPASFRAGRFGIGHSTGKYLMELGYHTDSSVTPHILWTTRTGEKRPDFRKCDERPYFINRNGDIWKQGNSLFLEVPVTIVKGEVARGWKSNPPMWFRPWYSDSETIRKVIEKVAAESSKANHSLRPLVMMFHNVELVAGASPYPQTEAEISLYIDMLRNAFTYANELGFESSTLEQFYQDQLAVKESKKDFSPLSITDKKNPDRNISIPTAIVDEALKANNVQPWFRYIFRERSSRWDIWESCSWIARNISPEKNILETGSGVGFNLIWLAERGFSRLYGFDIDPKAVLAGIEIAENSRLSLNLWIDDGLSPSLLPRIKYAAIFALNWTFLIENFSFSEFFETYIPFLEKNGVLIFDVIDSSYNNMSNNQYLSSDLDRPVRDRRPSEYKIRLSEEEVKEIANRYGLRIIRIISEEQDIPKKVYIASSSSLEDIYKANSRKAKSPMIPKVGYGLIYWKEWIKRRIYKVAEKLSKFTIRN